MVDQHAVIPVSISTKARAVEMLGLLNALPDGPEKAKLMASDQVEEWRRHDAAPLRRYAHKVTTAEREQGYTLDPKTGEKIKFKKMGQRCDECGCVSQELKRHQKTAKCIKAVLENERLMVEREQYFKKVVCPSIRQAVAPGRGLTQAVNTITIPGWNDVAWNGVAWRGVAWGGDADSDTTDEEEEEEEPPPPPPPANNTCEFCCARDASVGWVSPPSWGHDVLCCEACDIDGDNYNGWNDEEEEAPPPPPPAPKKKLKLKIKKQK